MTPALQKQLFVPPTQLAKPVLKWAGGKTQLLPEINKNYPSALLTGEVDTYIEPFVGGGAVFFDIANNHTFKKAYLFDTNPELIVLYNSLKTDVERVITELGGISEGYLTLESEEQRKNYFYGIRESYNSQVAIMHKAVSHTPFNANRAAMTIFLNRTCFNGLFRVNSKGHFNVPHGRYINPTILFPEALRAASAALRKATILLGDFTNCAAYVEGKTFIYYDPPYRPVSETAQFTSYAMDGFTDSDQIRLGDMFKKLHRQGVFQLLSNSDPTNYVDDPFFDNLYADFTILRVDAKRMINANANKRGNLREILVRNY
jgi:DNA adenine methylase